MSKRLQDLNVVYRDNEGDVYIRCDNPDADVTEAVESYEIEQLAEKLVAMDAQWAAEPDSDLQSAYDRIHELERDGSLRISALEDRHRSLAVTAGVMVMGALATGVLIGRLML